MARRHHCAYNQTRECFLALEIRELDLQTEKPADSAISFVFNSGEGLWLCPFNETPQTEMDVPGDLVFLDERATVLEVAESSSSLGRSQINPRIASLLVLPRHTVYSSQTQPGDRLIVCTAGEMTRRLENISEPPGVGVVHRTALLSPAPCESGGPQEKQSTVSSNIAVAQSVELSEPEPKTTSQTVVYSPPGNWLTRWWTPDPRRSQRLPVENLVAYYWTGATPTAQGIRDINLRGLYMVTEERWYLGTLVLLTLQRTDPEEGMGECSIRVYTRVVRTDTDGVGLQFVLPDNKDRMAERKSLTGSATRKGLEMFLMGLRAAKC